MYCQILFKFESLEDKGNLSYTKVEFPGFDGNNETTYLVYTRY
ncbi:hypothetical protein J9317_17450 [Metabacillus sp. KIGAM252]|uniref:Uncharacterized protein n=1 Tax=Metabacillus flavus TaxID=2823519 RepID=A0ABS5LJK2_9BACI|nr:hypothetical protein [Metabacillus flavus]